MLPICSHLGLEVSVLPTALVSNNFAYGSFDVLDTTDFMARTFEHWKNLGFKFDAVYTGFMASREQSELVARFCNEYRSMGIAIFTDPIMGDHGSLYNGMSNEDVINMRSLIKCSDFIMPNLTEACLLTDTACSADGFTRQRMQEILLKLRSQCQGTILITSSLVDAQSMVYGFDAVNNAEIALPYENLNKEFHGTGDVFAALFISKMTQIKDVEKAARYAMDTVASMIKRNLDNDDLFDGLNIGACLDLI